MWAQQSDGGGSSGRGSLPARAARGSKRSVSLVGNRSGRLLCGIGGVFRKLGVPQVNATLLCMWACGLLVLAHGSHERTHARTPACMCARAHTHA